MLDQLCRFRGMLPTRLPAHNRNLPEAIADEVQQEIIDKNEDPWS